MDWEEYFPDASALIDAIEHKLLADKERINYTNMRYKLFDQAESPWLYDVSISYIPGFVVITDAKGQRVTLAEENIDYLKLRPFYFAACIGFKAFVLYAHPNNDNEQSL